MKLLLVEDEAFLMDEMENYLTQQEYLCEKASNFKEAEEKISLYQYECVVLDITLPGGSGLNLLQLLKKTQPETGALIISARDSLRDKLTGLELGADDYITKPFHLEELNARINALIRRKIFRGDTNIIQADLVVNTVSKTVEYKGTPIVLTRKEYQLLLYLIINKNRVLSKQSIAEHLWGDHFDLSDNYDSVYVHITNLRKKIMAVTEIEFIKSVYGMGYKWIGL